jgi:hypothetical protein
MTGVFNPSHFSEHHHSETGVSKVIYRESLSSAGQNAIVSTENMICSPTLRD